MFKQDGVKVIGEVVGHLEMAMRKLKTGSELCVAKKQEITDKISGLNDEHDNYHTAHVRAEKLATKIQELLN
jgi:hypothetical protein